MSESFSSAVPALEFENVQVAYKVRGVDRLVLREVSFAIAAGESYGLVGESGCGKSTAAYTAVRYLPRNATIVGGQIRFEGRDVVKMSNEEVRLLRAEAMSPAHAATRCSTSRHRVAD